MTKVFGRNRSEDAVGVRGLPAAVRRGMRLAVLEANYECRVLEGQRGGMRRLVVRAVSGRGGIGWDALQMLKDEYLGPDAVAVEVYPAAHDAVDEVNQRHLWEVPPDFLPFGLHGR